MEPTILRCIASSMPPYNQTSFNYLIISNSMFGLGDDGAKKWAKILCESPKVSNSETVCATIRAGGGAAKLSPGTLPPVSLYARAAMSVLLSFSGYGTCCY